MFCAKKLYCFDLVPGMLHRLCQKQLIEKAFQRVKVVSLREKAFSMQFEANYANGMDLEQ